VQNAQRYFDRAKRSRLSARETATRSGTLQLRLERAEELLARLEPVRTEQELSAFMLHNMQDLEDLGLGPRTRARAELPFRVFSVDGGFEVWAGKSSTNNDLLTLKHAKPNDLWFHARGASGSHVVLKVASAKGEPSKKAKQQAASIAAYYSKMKNASTVPVAMTEKKYVRKPKGGSPGTAVLEREKVLFVEPCLPAGDQP
jgi:predicted ribosome quality control (RQC) complex YloA/Tae2 family protein